MKDSAVHSSVKGDDHHPPLAWPSQARTPGDVRKPYLEACDEWAEATRRHHVASVAVASGTGTAEALAVAKREESEALGRVLAARADIGELFFAMLRVILADPTLKYGLMVKLLDVLGPALEPVADRLNNLELVVGGAPE